MDNRINYAERAAFLKALSNPIRLQIVHSLLVSGCHNVSCMEQGTGMSQSCIVTAERVGNEVYYRVGSEEVAPLVASLLKEEASSYVS